MSAPTPIRDDPASRAAFEALLALHDDGSEPSPRGVCIDTRTDALTLVRYVPITNPIVVAYTGRTHRASITDLFLAGIPVPVEPAGAALVARRNRIAAEEMRREVELKNLRARRVLPERPPHDPHERPDAPPEAVGA